MPKPSSLSKLNRNLTRNDREKAEGFLAEAEIDLKDALDFLQRGAYEDSYRHLEDVEGSVSKAKRIVDELIDTL